MTKAYCGRRNQWISGLVQNSTKVLQIEEPIEQ
ncbi:hypothetical protein CIPAW_02G025300 [Carya illinoinensis]|uniref:Uncharacterized protein n=1 Tax=Carya illinoinensis TaxID=32201 RepID=A0A8T1RBD6_CARIL|nr:hypothetical protein CIPAW_02G025300 [Carya illinoinensis]